MGDSFDFGKEWEKTKEQWAKISKEASLVAHKSERELIKLTQKGRLHLDSTAAGLKKEHLYYLIGKEYSKVKAPVTESSHLKKLKEELKKVDREQRSIKKKLKEG